MVPSRMPSSAVTEVVAVDHLARLAVEAALLDGHDLVVEPALVTGLGRLALASGAEGVEVLPRQAPLVGDQLGGDALRDEVVAGQHLRAEGDQPGVIDAPIGVVVITSTPAATTTS